MSDLQIVFLGGHLWLTILLCVALVGLTVAYYRKTTPPISPFVRWLLVFLRAIAVCALFLALAQPILSYTTAHDHKKRLALLLDRSRSMTLPAETAGNRSRLDVAQEAIASGPIAALSDKLDITPLAFAESLDVSPAGEHLSGRSTNFEQALKQLRENTTFEPYDYILAVSDGRATEGETIADLAVDLRRPLYTLAVGDSLISADLALENVDYNEVIYAGRSTEITAFVSQRGEFNTRPRLTLREGNKVLAEKTIELPGDGKGSDVSLNFTPAQPGRLILDLELSSNADEANLRNNRQKFSVKVLKSKLRILLYASSVNQEYAFLNRFLAGTEDYEVIRCIDARGGDRLGERFPDTREKLNSFDLVILLDPDLSRLSQYYDQFMTYLSDRGGSLWLFMGEKYAQSAAGNRLESIFPLAVSERRVRMARYGKYHLLPDPQMIFHPAVKLADTREEISAVWVGQPPFTMAVPIDSVRSDGVVLGYLATESQDEGRPALAMRQVKAGKILAAAVSPFWHWAMLPYGVGGDAGYYRALLSGTIRWLTAGDETGRVTLSPEKPIFQSGEEVVFVGSARDEGFRPIDNAGGSVTVTSDKGESSVAQVMPEPDKPGRYRVRVGILPPGTYSYRAELSAENVNLGRFEGKVAVDEIDRETAFGDVDWTAMARAAQISGGAFASWHDAAPLVAAIDTTPTREEIKHEYRLWDNLVLLLIILGGLSAEWIIRKQRQLL